MTYSIFDHRCKHCAPRTTFQFEEAVMRRRNVGTVAWGKREQTVSLDSKTCCFKNLQQTLTNANADTLRRQPQNVVQNSNCPHISPVRFLRAARTIQPMAAWPSTPSCSFVQKSVSSGEWGGVVVTTEARQKDRMDTIRTFQMHVHAQQVPNQTLPWKYIKMEAAFFIGNDSCLHQAEMLGANHDDI